MPPLGRKFEAPPLTPEELVTKDALRQQGRTVRAQMTRLLPYLGKFGSRRTNTAEYHAGGEAADTLERVWLIRDGKHRAEPIQLKLSSVSLVKAEGGVEWPTQTLATIDLNGYLIDEKFQEFFPAQRLAYLKEVMQTLAVIEAQAPPERARQLGKTALGN